MAPRVPGSEQLEDGCTPGYIELSRTPSGVYILALKAETNPENRFVPQFSRAIHKAFDAIERHLESHPADPAALLTVSESPKFFSNGIDPTGSYHKQFKLPVLSNEEMIAGGRLIMPAMTRPLQLPVPTVAAVGGHAFGAGMMFALSHDYRLQRSDRGFMCAIEVEIGVGIPPPEIALFKHAMPLPAFYETVMAAKRWGASEALQAGLIVKASHPDNLFAEALKYAESQAKFAKGERMRKNFMSIKNKAKGHVARMVMEETFPTRGWGRKGEALLGRVRDDFPYLMKHLGESIEEVETVPTAKL